jgi:predicted dehydrogenase
MGQGWLKLLHGSPMTEVVGLVDIRHEAALKGAEQVGLSKERASTDLKAMLRDLKPDAVVDVTVPAAHKEVTVTALEAGCHVLGEKPLADSMDNARQMVQTAARTGKIYMISQNYRWNPTVRAIRKAVADGLIGNLTTANIDFYIGAHFGGFRDQMAHPLLLDMSIHHFDMLRCVTGADPEAAYCHEFNPKGSWYAGDVATSAVFEMSQGLVFTYRGSWCAEGHNTGWNGVWRIVGDKGTIAWDGGDKPMAEVLTGVQEGFTRPKEQKPVPAADEGASGLEGSLKRFCDAIQSGGQPETWCGDNIKSLAMVFAAVESAGRKERLKVTW